MKYTLAIICIYLAVTYACKCRKPEKGDEVCGSDGIDYNSECHLFCARHGKDPAGPCLRQVSVGNCTETSCRCSDPCKPLCGTNGIEYGNDCLLECDQKQNPELKKAYEGSCKA